MDDAPSVDALEGEGVLKHKDPKTPSPQKIVSVQQTTQEEYSRRIQEGLINKAYRIFGWALFLLFVVFCIGHFTDGDTDLVTEMIRILFSILTFLLGYLFATIRN